MKKTSEEIRKLSEQFTIHGFIAVSFWAVAYSWFIFQSLVILDNFGWYDMNNFWKTAAIIYVITWFLCFLFICAKRQKINITRPQIRTIINILKSEKQPTSLIPLTHAPPHPTLPRLQ